MCGVWMPRAAGQAGSSLGGGQGGGREQHTRGSSGQGGAGPWAGRSCRRAQPGSTCQLGDGWLSTWTPGVPPSSTPSPGLALTAASRSLWLYCSTSTRGAPGLGTHEGGGTWGATDQLSPQLLSHPAPPRGQGGQLPGGRRLQDCTVTRDKQGPRPLTSDPSDPRPQNPPLTGQREEHSQQGPAPP